MSENLTETIETKTVIKISEGSFAKSEIEKVDYKEEGNNFTRLSIIQHDVKCVFDISDIEELIKALQQLSQE